MGSVMNAYGGGNTTINRARYEAARELNQGEIGEAPEWLPEKAKVLWDMIVDHYAELPVLCEMDAPALTSLCLAAAKQEQVEMKLAECYDADEEKQLLKVKKDYEATFKAYSAMFGLSPKDRSSLAQAMREAQIDSQERADPLLKALSLGE